MERRDVSVLKKIWIGETKTRQQVLVASTLVVAVGIALIIAGVVANWGQTRVFGALLITVGGAAGGAAIGFAEPVRAGVWSKLTGWRVWIAIVASVIIISPALLAMGSATFGPIAGGGASSDKAIVAVGVLFGFVMLVGSFLAAIIAVQATQRRVTPGVNDENAAPGGEDRP